MNDGGKSLFPPRPPFIFCGRFFFPSLGLGLGLSLWLCAWVLSLAPAACAQSRAPKPAPRAAPTFGRIRALSLPAVREIALRRSGEAGAIALAGSRLQVARAALRDESNRFRPNVGGGIDPFSGRVRYYLSLDLERLAQLNSAARNTARQAVSAE